LEKSKNRKTAAPDLANKQTAKKERQNENPGHKLSLVTLRAILGGA